MELKEIGLEIVEKLRKDKLDLIHLWLLENLIEGTYIEVPDMNALKRRLFCLEGEITEKGKDYYNSLISGTTRSQSQSRDNITEQFNKWWGTREIEGAYPSTNAFFYEGRKFSGSQAKKIKKEECRLEFQKIVLSGDFSAEEIIQGTENHILAAKRTSLRKGENQISFIPNSYRYLRERLFSAFIEATTETKKEQRVDPTKLF